MTRHSGWSPSVVNTAVVSATVAAAAAAVVMQLVMAHTAAAAAAVAVVETDPTASLHHTESHEKRKDLQVTVVTLSGFCYRRLIVRLSSVHTKQFTMLT